MVNFEHREDFRFHRLQTSQRACVDGVSNLLTHAVDAIRAQQVDSLLHQVSAATAQHTEAQVLQEFRFSGGGIQSPRGTDTVIRSKVGKARDLQHKQMNTRKAFNFFSFFLGNSKGRKCAQEI